jgi:RNA methyltransferase, TrmH family
MPESHRLGLIPAGLKHPRVREFLAVKRHAASHSLPGAVTLEGTWMIRHALVAGVRLQAVFVCPALLRGAEGLALAGKAVDLAMPVVAVGRPAARQWLRERGFRIVAADPAGSRSYRDVDYRGPLAIVVGSERRGLAPEWLAVADSIAAIPMLGISDSVNAAVAGALLLYEALAQHSHEP